MDFVNNCVSLANESVAPPIKQDNNFSQEGSIPLGKILFSLTSTLFIHECTNIPEYCFRSCRTQQADSQGAPVLPYGHAFSQKAKQNEVTNKVNTKRKFRYGNVSSVADLTDRNLHFPTFFVNISNNLLALMSL